MKFRQLIIFLLLALRSNHSICQNVDSVKYSVVFKNCCSEEVPFGTIHTDWHVVDESGKKCLPLNKTVKLNQTINNYLISGFFKNEPVKIILNNQLNIDTFKTSCVQYIYPDQVFTWNPVHLTCNDTLNGKYEEYHFNGKLRLRGNFLNGRIVDSLNTYFLNGNLESSKVVEGENVSYKTFFENKSLKNSYDPKLNYSYTYSKEGKVISKYSNKKGTSYYKYDNGNLRSKKKKKKEFIYYRNQNLEESLVKKPVFFLQDLRFKNDSVPYRYCWTTYDSLGMKKKVVEFYSKYSCSLQTNYIALFAKDFSQVTYHADGKRKISISAIYFEGKESRFRIMYRLAEYEKNKIVNSRDILENEYQQIIKEFE